jgi:hypothetical protein
VTVRVVAPKRATNQKQKCWTQALSTCADDVLCHLPNQWDLCGQPLADHAVNMFHVLADQVQRL